MFPEDKTGTLTTGKPKAAASAVLCPWTQEDCRLVISAEGFLLLRQEWRRSMARVSEAEEDCMELHRHAEVYTTTPSQHGQLRPVFHDLANLFAILCEGV